MAEAKPKEKDIVNTYPKLVGSFVALQVVTWVLALLEAAGVLGVIADALNTQCGVIDVNLCLMMFFGTLHHGMLSDKRLAIVCRVAFCVDAACYFLRYAFVFRPATLILAMNVSVTAEVPTAAVITGYVNGGIWLFIMVVIVAWLGIRMLELGRRRLFEHGSLAAFSDRFLRVSLGLLGLQLAFMVYVLIVSATAVTAEERFYAQQVVDKSFNFTSVIAQLYGFKVMIFDGSGTHTITKLSRSGIAALVCVVLFGVSATVHFASTVLMQSSALALDIKTFMEGKYFAVSFMTLAFYFISIQYGLTCLHLVNFDRGEERRQQRIAEQQGGPMKV